MLYSGCYRVSQIRRVLGMNGAGHLILLALFIPMAAQADGITSAYTSLDFETDCTITDAPPEGEPASWARLECDGYKGLPVHVIEDDLRMAISYGGVAAPGRWQDFFRGFSDVHDVIEWRLRTKNGLKPFATIHRWYVNTRRWTAEQKKEGGRREILVLSTVAREPDEVSCVFGYIDAGLNPDANRLAREVADDKAASFRCDKDEPVWYGAVQRD